MATTSKFDFGLINDQIKTHTDQIGDVKNFTNTVTQHSISAAQNVATKINPCNVHCYSRGNIATIYGEFVVTEQIDNGAKADLFTGLPLLQIPQGYNMWMGIINTVTGRTHRLILESTKVRTWYSGNIEPGNYVLIPVTIMTYNTL